MQGKVEGLIQIIQKGKFIDHILLIFLIRALKIKNHILIMTDAFTKFVRMYPTRTTKTAEAIAHLKTYFNSYSKPQTLISDRASCFTSSEFAEFVSEY